jgi:amino acid transporter
MLFGISYVVISILEIPQTVTNMMFMIYPAIIAGYSFVFRVKLSKEEENKAAARKEYIMLVSITTFLVLISFLYSILLRS